MKRFCSFVKNLVQTDVSSTEDPNNITEETENGSKLDETLTNQKVPECFDKDDSNCMEQLEAAANNKEDIATVDAEPENSESTEPDDQSSSVTNSHSTQESTNLEIADVIHPLQNTWSLWFFKHNRTKEWHDNLRHVISFSSVEDFWSIYQSMKKPSTLPSSCDYFLFKANIQPMWEDRANLHGGRWMLKLDSGPESKETLDRLWLETLLALIGETFDQDADHVCGAVAQVRRSNDKVCVWTRNAADRATCLRIGKKWKTCLPHGVNLTYEAHEDNEIKGRNNALYVA